MRLGVVGYGMGGRYFHTPFIQAANGIELVGIVTRSTERAAQVELDAPGTPVYSSLGELIDAGVDAVTIATPPATRRELVLEALSRGVHVVADKPFAPDPAGGVELVRAAERAGLMLSVFQNRPLCFFLRELLKTKVAKIMENRGKHFLRCDQT